MKRTARATKIEKLPDEEQVFVIGRIDARQTPAKICAEYQERFSKHLAESTVYSYIERRWLPSKVEAEQTVALAKEFINLRGQNPEIPEDVLLRGFLRQRQASRGFQEGPIEPETVISAELSMRRLDIEERRVKAIEEKNRIANEKVALDVKRLQLQLKRMQKEVERATHEAEKKIGKGESLTRADINRIRERVFGLPETATGH